MGTRKKNVVDPETVKAIEEDMAAMYAEDTEPEEQPEEGETRTCSCTGLSPDGAPGTGLLDADTICPECKGSGQVPVSKLG